MTAALHQLGDRISSLTLLESRQLSDYLRDVHGIDPVVSPGVASPRAEPKPGDEASQPASCDVMLTGFNGTRVAIIRAVRAITGSGLQEVKQAVDGLPFKIGESLAREQAETVKAQLEAVGGTVDLT